MNLFRAIIWFQFRREQGRDAESAGEVGAWSEVFLLALGKSQCWGGYYFLVEQRVWFLISVSFTLDANSRLLSVTSVKHLL